MSTQEWFHLFLLCLSYFEVLFCEYIEKDPLSNLTSIEEKALVSGSRDIFEETFLRRPKKAPEESRHLNRKRKPNRNDTEYLFGLMGDDFKPEWMSVRKPKKPWKTIPLSEVSLNDSEAILASEKNLTLLENFSFTKELAHLQPDLLPYENEIKSWLTKRASCSVGFRWKSLGSFYWPSWFRYGHCLQLKKKCSLPFGMRCVPAEVIDLYFLRWKCAKRIEDRRDVPDIVTFVNYANKKKGQKMDYPSTERTKCEWERVSIPITVICQCSC